VGIGRYLGVEGDTQYSVTFWCRVKGAAKSNGTRDVSMAAIAEPEVVGGLCSSQTLFRNLELKQYGRHNADYAGDNAL
jgi:hypothetical protein